MRTLSVNEAQSKFGEIVELVRTEPVQVTSEGRPAFMMLSVDDYETYEEIRAIARARAKSSFAEMQQHVNKSNLSEEEKNEILADAT